ncbi:MAG TPA: hypothetical protein VHQ24_00340 [Lachnospiraceae bacterium]|nr:hypothetical protein [Lachnospiraceae bacterium]
MEKGKNGYIKSKKRKQLLLTVSIAVVALILFLVGFILNDYSKSNIFTILTILLCLPAAKALTGFIVIAPYHSMKIEDYQELEKLIQNDDILLSDLVITSSEKVMNLDCMFIDGKHLLALQGKAGQDLSYIETYLVRHVKNLGYEYEVKIFKENSKYMNRIKDVTRNHDRNASQDSKNDVVRLIKTLII